ncbi:phage shock protein A (PspA) family protein [Cognatiyoonia koreensis]|uniref:Phage shock protein A (PspA) family protein n=1 Tax=Cognatiyoonia koreensis TaxID=364200 RepID=A0A1I0QRF8_9RHOB|nr:PspA/IM30 family protein [Cognatiyoonia koreensis]SEW30103.1 phage shock protein A (PspA) family protein [Cognatiyoonia koreensis]
MFKTLATLIHGANARGEDRIRDAFAIELIDQKIREAEGSLKVAKATLASLIQRQRAEENMRVTLQKKVDDLMGRAEAALDDGREDMATQAAKAIASMENELAVRNETLNRLDQKILRLRMSIEAGHRRIIDLKQGAIQARAVRREQDIQSRMNATIRSSSSAEEAEELIARVLGRDDPFEQAEILSEINDGLAHDGVTNRLADAGYGAATRSTAEDVLARLKLKTK